MVKVYAEIEVRFIEVSKDLWTNKTQVKNTGLGCRLNVQTTGLVVLLVDVHLNMSGHFYWVTLPRCSLWPANDIILLYNVIA
jgi:hypothetical protein